MGVRRAGIKPCKPLETYGGDALFDILVKYDSMKGVIGAGSSKGGSASDGAGDSRNGICQGHACKSTCTPS